MSKGQRRKDPLIAVFNTTPEVIELLTELLESEGFNVISAIVSDFRRGKRDLLEFMAEHGPDIILYDIPPPYEEQLRFLRLVQNLEVMKGIMFIYTTTNRAALEKIEGGRIDAHEIIGKPYDLNELLAAVAKAVASWKKG